VFTVITKLLFSFFVVLHVSVSMASGAPVTAQPASVAFIGTERTKYGNTVYCFRVTNTSPKSLFYYGYGSASPLYDRQTQSWFQWRDSRLGWCGVDSAFQRIAPGRSFVFTADRASWFWPWRVGIRLSPRPSYAVAESTYITIWSPPVR
jgi:hypothetical protein